MAMAMDAHLTGDAVAERKAHDILALLPPYQHADGSFPHWCVCSKDIHYTGWMSQELIYLERILNDPVIAPALAGTHRFLEARVDSTGHSHYEQPCPGQPGCMEYFDSQRSGCDYDYDTRGWTVEPGYIALVFDHFHSPNYLPVMNDLISLENRGTFADKWDFIPPPDDPEYPWSIADTSVANMSIIFWSMSMIESGRGSEAPQIFAEDDEDQPEDGAADGARRGVPGFPTRPAVEAARLARVPEGVATRGGPTNPLLRALPDRPDYCNAPVSSGGPGDGQGEAIGRGGSGMSAAAAAATLAGAVRLEPAFPNPIERAAELRFYLPGPAQVSLDLYDLGGRSVRRLVEGPLAAGWHVTRWDRLDSGGRECRAGVYFARLRLGGMVRAGGTLVLR
jgi:hypothetical protein